MSAPANLLVDIGNTAIKSALVCSQKPEQLGDISYHADHQALSRYITAHAGQIAYLGIANVNRQSIVDDLLSNCRTLNISAIEAHSQSYGFGVRNAYSKVENMGVDRWLAIIAAQHLSQGDFVVIDAGTAITFDFVVAGEHKGGWIAPGSKLLSKALTSNTQRVFAEQIASSAIEWGKDTPDCVTMGIKAQIQGSLILAIEKMREYSPDFCIWVTGGDQQLFSACADIPLYYHKNLVLQGLSLFVAQKVG